MGRSSSELHLKNTSIMGRRNVYLGKSEAEHCYETPHDDDDNICIKHSAVMLGDTWWEVSVPLFPNGSVMNIVSSKGNKSAGGALLVDKVLCTTTKTEEEIQQWVDAYKTKHTKFDIVHDNSFHFCNAFVRFLSEGSTDLKKVFKSQSETGEGAPEQEFILGGVRVLGALLGGVGRLIKMKKEHDK